MLTDLRYAFRSLGKSPGFTATVIVTLALGIGACLLVFSTVDTILLELSDDPATARNVILRQPKPSQPVQAGDRVSAPDFLDIQKQAKSFEFMAAGAARSFTLTGRDEPLAVVVSRNTEHHFAMGGSKPALGRLFLPEEFKPGNGRVVVITHAFWQNVLGGDPDVVSRSLQLNGEPYEIVGVMSLRFERLGSDINLWMPLDLADTRRGTRNLDVAARLRPGVTVAQAQAEMDVIAARLAEEHPATNQGYGINVTLRSDYVNRFFRPVLSVLLGAVACVLLIVCANVANLLLVRASARRREIALRAALGATRPRLMRQLLTESFLLALVGGAAGVLLAQWGVMGVRACAESHPQMARLASVQLDAGLLVVALGLTIATGFFFGLAPAWLGSRVALNESLKQGNRGSTEGGASGRLRRVLVVAEVACAVVLLAGAGLFVGSFARLTHVDLGFEPEQAAMMRVFLPAQKYAKPEQRLAFADALLERLHALPGVEAAAVSNRFPLDGSVTTSQELSIEGRPPPGPADHLTATLFAVTPEYFKAMGMRLVRGRLLTELDHPTAPRVVVINETLARLHFAHEDPLGRRIHVATGDGQVVWREIVGIVADVATGDPAPADRCQVYDAFAQRNTGFLTAIVRMSGDPAALLPLLKPPVFAVDPDQPVTALSTVEDLVRRRVSFPRFTMRLLGAFSFVALVIAAVGIYGVMAYSVSQRTAEIGIRMALGASTAVVLRAVLGQGAKIVGVGLALGLGATLAASRLVQSLLYGTNPRDPVTLAAITLALALVALVACWLPARRATKVDPIVALRSE